MEIQEFKESLKNNQCPFCGEKLEYYDGCLGYEAMRCYKCGFAVDHQGIQIEDLRDWEGKQDGKGISD